MAKKPTPAEPGSPRVLSVPPINVIKRPLRLPPMERVQGAIVLPLTDEQIEGMIATPEQIADPNVRTTGPHREVEG